MPTTTPLTDAINALTQYANETTGQSDTTLSDAVGTLVAGYGGGGVSLVDIFRKTYPSGDVVVDDDTAFDIPGHFFQGFTGITSFSSNKAQRINGYAFQNCFNMATVNFPSCTQLDGSCFENCSALAAIDLSNSYQLSGGNQFRACTSLVDFLCWANGTATNMFYGCSNLESLDMAHLSVYNVAGGCFNNCAKLNVLVLRKTSGIVALANIAAFNGTPFASGGAGGTLYVPNALKSSYQSAAQWSTILGYANNQIKAIEGSQYETAYADGTPIE